MKNDREIAEHTNRKLNISKTGSATNVKCYRDNVIVNVFDRTKFESESMKTDREITERTKRK